MKSLSYPCRGISDVKSLLYLLHPAISCLLLLVDNRSDPTSTDVIFWSSIQTMLSKLPAIERLMISCPHLPIQEEMDVFANALVGLKRLRTACFNYHLICAPAVWSIMAHLEELKLIDCFWGTTSSGTVPTLLPAFQEGCFLTLDKIRLRLNYVDTISLFSHTAPPRLQRLDLYVADMAESWDLFDSIGSTATSLRHLRISTGVQCAPISMNNILALASITDLTELCLWTNSATDIRDDDITRIAKAFPNLSKLILAPNPSIKPIPPPQLTYKCLLPLAKSCPRLKLLGLYIDMNSVIDPGEPYHRFGSAIQLNVGLSPAPTDKDLAARFLSSILPHKSTVYFQHTRRDRRPKARVVPSHHRQCCLDWLEIHSMILKYQKLDRETKEAQPISIAPTVHIY